uniref:Chromo domain-containing protein n=1 Tax=Ananas comosus var. bracteatus TaxID=296719 RepID=A0A6V7Q678_ANACO|nr:unnamed protein product [Ananas comosus var. bracteatus]
MLVVTQPPLIEQMKRLELEVVAPDTPLRLMTLVVQPTLLERIKEKQVHDVELQKIRAKIVDGYTGDFLVDNQGMLRFRGRICVPVEDILQEAHRAPYAIPLELREDLSFEEQPVRIFAREVKKLRNRDIPYVKVLWSNHDKREVMWELESALQERYPHLFQMES